MDIVEIKKLREELLTLKERGCWKNTQDLSNQTGVSMATIYQLISGKSRGMTLDVANKLVAYINLKHME